MSCGALIAVGIHLLSWHSDGRYNDVNPGIYGRSDCGLVEDDARVQDGLQAGAYYNSERALSFYGAYVIDAYPLERAPWLGFFASVGLATGYERHDLLPIALAGVNIRPLPRWTFKVGYAPKVEKINDTHLLTATLQYHFKGIW
jgi:hypothetical protein